MEAAYAITIDLKEVGLFYAATREFRGRVFIGQET
jgi:hypothetical protein